MNKNKIIIVTGSEGGIGSAIVKKLQSNNVTPIPLDIKCGFDITNDDDRKEIFNKYKIIDGIVIAHGINRRSWDETIEINLTSIYEFLTLLHTRMIEYGGSIVNITSLSSIQGFPDNPQYVASKGGLRYLTKALAVDWGKYNIRVNNVCPGYIKTKMTENSYNNPKLKQERDNRLILNRWGTPTDVANAVIFLLSERSSYITGIDLIVDGGWFAKGL